MKPSKCRAPSQVSDRPGSPTPLLDRPCRPRLAFALRDVIVATDGRSGKGRRDAGDSEKVAAEDDVGIPSSKNMLRLDVSATCSSAYDPPCGSRSLGRAARPYAACTGKSECIPNDATKSVPVRSAPGTCG